MKRKQRIAFLVVVLILGLAAIVVAFPVAAVGGALTGY